MGSASVWVDSRSAGRTADQKKRTDCLSYQSLARVVSLDAEGGEKDSVGVAESVYILGYGRGAIVSRNPLGLGRKKMDKKDSFYSPDFSNSGGKDEQPCQ